MISKTSFTFHIFQPQLLGKDLLLLLYTTLFHMNRYVILLYVYGEKVKLDSEQYTNTDLWRTIRCVSIVFNNWSIVIDYVRCLLSINPFPLIDVSRRICSKRHLKTISSFATMFSILLISILSLKKYSICWLTDFKVKVLGVVKV